MSEPQTPFDDVIEHAGDVKIHPSTGMAAIAMNMAMRWHDMCMIKDGALYQQKKVEGANIQVINLNDVLRTAKQIEAWLLTAPNRHAEMLVEGICEGLLQTLDDNTEEGIKRIPDTES